MIILELQQDTPEWWQWRSKGIGASDAAAIMGECKYKNKAIIRESKMNPQSFETMRASQNKSKRQGVKNEPLARAAYIEHSGLKVEPTCIQHEKLPWMRASLDGLDHGTRTCVEIKCGSGTYFQCKRLGKVPNHHKAQCQHILAILGYQRMDFWAYLQSHPPIVLQVERDEAYIETLIQKEAEFARELDLTQL